MSIKINSLELESVKKIKAVKLKPSENGLTVIGGKNCAGKTSVLDAICWALGGEKFRPSNPQREGDYNTPTLHVVLSNGIVVERKGKNSDLKVTDEKGNRHGQTLLNSFIEELALNLPKFMQSSNAEKAKTLLQIIGVGDKLCELESAENRLYNERHAVGQMAEQKKKYALELPHFENVPEVPVSASELIRQQQEILMRNEENRKKRLRVAEFEAEKDRLEKLLSETQEAFMKVVADLNIAKQSAEALEDQSTEELEKSISDIDALNIKIRANLDRERAFEESDALSDKYKELTADIEQIRSDRLKLLESADLPLPELSVQDGELTYKGHKWDCLSGAEQLRVATAIVRKLKPDCGFVLLDKLEQMDLDTLREFGLWLEEQGLQAIATRVSEGPECSVIIQDGYVAEESPAPNYTKGVF